MKITIVLEKYVYKQSTIKIHVPFMYNNNVYFSMCVNVLLELIIWLYLELFKNKKVLMTSLYSCTE